MRAPIRPRRASKGREDRGASTDRAGRPASSEILDIAFHRAHRASPHGAARLDRARRRALLKIVRSTATVRRHLRLRAKPFEGEELTPFQRALIERTFGPGQLARALRRLSVAERRIQGVGRQAERAIGRTEGSEALATLVRSVYGRVASFTREIDPDLAELERIRRFLADRPRLDPSVPTVVVAGFPNVGKSSLVARLSTATPKVAAYPFTTLAIQVGHADLGFDRLQVLDTPGVLGRAVANPAEVEAETAVRGAASFVLFLLDPSERCGYPMAEQEALLARWRNELPNATFLEVETKGDLVESPTDRLRVSATTGAGLEQLRARLQALLAEHRPAPVEPPPPAEEETPRVESYGVPPLEEPPVPRRRRRGERL